MVELKLSRYIYSVTSNVGNVYRRFMPLRHYSSTFSMRFIEVGKPGSGHESQCNETSTSPHYFTERNGPERTRTPHYFTERNGRYSAVSDRALEKEKGYSVLD